MSWLGALLSALAFLLARRCFVGVVAPIFLTSLVTLGFIWYFVLRVPELRKFDPPVEEDCGEEECRAPVAPVEAGAPSGAAGEEASDDEEEEDEGAGVVADRPAGADVEPSAAGEEAYGSAASSSSYGAAASLPGPRPLSAPVPVSVPASSSSSSSAAVAAAPPSKASSSWVVNKIQEQKAEDAAAAAAAEKEYNGEAAAEAVTPLGSDAGPFEGEGHGDDDADHTSEVSEADSDRRRREEDAMADPAKAQELKLEGNEHFKAGKLHDAREAYSEALHLTPSSDKKDKAILHANRAACLQKLERWQEVVDDCKAAVDLDPEYVKAYCRRSAAFENLGRFHDSLEDLKKAIELDPSLKSKEYKRQAILEKRSQEQFDKDKDDMMGKLKELGNTVLGKFGMSCDNFKLVQDPNTGGYSVSYSQ